MDLFRTPSEEESRECDIVGVVVITVVLVLLIVYYYRESSLRKHGWSQCDLLEFSTAALFFYLVLLILTLMLHSHRISTAERHVVRW